VRAAGYSSLEVSSSTWTFCERDEREWWGRLWADRVRHSEFAHQGIEYGLTSSDELEGIAEAFLAWADDVNGLFVVVHAEVLARP
jgi:hypothetical protein